jgi:cell division transport system permease protein
VSRPTAILGFAVRHGLRGLRRRPGAMLWAAVAIGAALFALGTARLLDRNVARLTAGWRGGSDMIVYLADDVDDAGARELAAALGRLPAVERVAYVPPAAALDHLRAGLGDQAAMLEGVEPGLVPASLEVALAAGIADVAATHPLIARLEATPGVEDVEFVGDWVARADALSLGLDRGGGAVVALAAALALVLTAAAARLAIAGRRREARILELLGGTAGFRRGPVVVQGLVLGLGGALLACLALVVGFGRVAGPVSAALGRAVGADALGFLPLPELAILCVGGALVGALGGALAAAPGEARRA